MGRGFLLLPFLFTVFSISCFALTVREVSRFETEHLDSKFWGNNPIAWVASGGAPLKNDCDLTSLESQFKPELNVSTERAVLKDFFKRCETKLRRANYNPYYSLIGGVNFRYNYDQTKRFRNLFFENLQGRIVRAQLYLQQSSIPLPLVIFKCGLQSELGGAEARIASALIADGMPFHLLIVPSVTGLDYEIDNRTLAVGGYDEGQEIMDLARYFRDPRTPYAASVSSVHVIGVSLGGHAALYAALFNSFERRPLLQSVLALSPVVDLEPSVKGIYRSGELLSRYFFSTFVGAFGELLKVVPDLLNLLPPDSKNELSLRELPDVVARGGFTYYQKRSQDPAWRRPPYQDFPMNSIEDYWRLNRFEEKSNLVTTPTLVWAAADDHVVQAGDNARVLARSLTEKDRRAIQILVTPQGGHVDFWEAYGWSFANAIIKNHILVHSPELARFQKTHQYRFNVGESERQTNPVSWGNQRLSIEWRAVQNKDYFEIVDTRLIHTVNHCAGTGACVPFSHEFLIRIPRDLLGLPIPVPRSKTEAEAATRSLNSRVRIYNAKHETLGTTDSPALLEWVTYDR